MRQLTYADRELLLQTFDSLKSSWNGSDDALLIDACEFARRLSPSFGFEHGLTRDIAALSRYLASHIADTDIADIARGGLLYVMHASKTGPSALEAFDLLDDAFISSYAVHEIQLRLGERATYTPPRLTLSEQDRAEGLFLQFAERPSSGDDELITQATRIGDSLANLAGCGLLRRLQKNIDFLVSILRSADRNLEQRAYARAALAYLVCEQDAIDDRLGIVGYLDDNFIAQTAVDMIEPTREPWLDLLDATVGVWPFLNALVIDDGSGGRPISEYMIVNSALSCQELRGLQESQSTMLVSPVVGPVPFMLGFVTTLGLIHDSGQLGVSEKSFAMGQKVLVDGGAIAEFAGFDECNGRKMFKLRQFCIQHGQRLGSIHYWPISDLCRLASASSSRSTRGQLQHDLSRSDAILSGLEYLFKTEIAARLRQIEKHIVIVTPVAYAHEMANELSFLGHRLKDVIPMGHLTTDEGLRPWSTRFGKQAPLLIFVSNLDDACAFAEEEREANQLIIVDASGRNAHKVASLRRLQQLGISTLVVSPERSANELDMSEADRIGVWEWSTDDFSSLLWPEQAPQNGVGPIVRYERRLQSQAAVAPEIRRLEMPHTNRAFDAVRAIRDCARARGEDGLAELDDIVALSFNLMSRLLRSATPLTSDIPSTNEIHDDLQKLRNIKARSLFLSEAERSAISAADCSLTDLFIELKRNNPKAVLLQEVLSTQPNAVIVCPDARIRSDLEIAYADTNVRVLYSVGDDDYFSAGAVIPGWFRKDRMAMLLVPPVTSPMFLLLYHIEQEWHSAFHRERRHSCETRRLKGNRARLFPKVEGWGKPVTNNTDEAVSSQSASLDALEAIQKEVQASYRQRVYKASRSDGSEVEVKARFVLFDGDTYALLTDSYKAKVVTHLLDSSIDDPEDKADIRQVPAKKLKPGDALLFHRGSERDVIRTAADEILPVGVRELSAMWREALLKYVANEKLTSEQLWNHLRAAGCPLQLPTIRNWLDSDDTIAPQDYERDIQIILAVTGDTALTRSINDVLTAISEVRGAHLRASHRLAQQVIAKAAVMLKNEKTLSLVEVESNVVVVRVVDVDDQLTQVRVSLINRLLEGNQWHE